MLIYKATNIINGKVYIGQTIRSFRKRKWDHIYKAENSNTDYYFHKAIRKYGKENFKWEVLCELDNIDDLNEMEEFCIEIFNSFGAGGYNMNNGGKNAKMSNETKIKISENKKGKLATDETKLKMSKSQKCRTATDETKLKMSKSQKGKITSDETKLKISETKMGHVVSVETIEKLRILGFNQTEQKKKNISNSLKNYWKIKKSND